MINLSLKNKFLDKIILDLNININIIQSESSFVNKKIFHFFEKGIKENNLNIENWNYISKFKTYIAVDANSFAEKWGKELIKKTVNIPKWINTKAEALKINFSKTLEEALLQKIFK